MAAELEKNKIESAAAIRAALAMSSSPSPGGNRHAARLADSVMRSSAMTSASSAQSQLFYSAELAPEAFADAATAESEDGRPDVEADESGQQVDESGQQADESGQQADESGQQADSEPAEATESGQQADSEPAEAAEAAEADAADVPEADAAAKTESGSDTGELAADKASSVPFGDEAALDEATQEDDDLGAF